MSVLDMEYRHIQFDGSNYSHWKYRMEILLEERALKGYIEHELVEILARVQVQERDKMRHEEKKSKARLVRCISLNT